jgi:hypothetical protein
MLPTVLVEPLDVSRRLGCQLRMLLMDLAVNQLVATESVRRRHWASVTVTAGLSATPDAGEVFAGHDVRILIKIRAAR